MMHEQPPVANVSDASSVLGPRLRAIRLRRGLSLRELARRLELSPSSISQIETGKMQPSVRTLYAFVSEFGVTRRRGALRPGAAAADARPRRPTRPGRGRARARGAARGGTTGDHAQLRRDLGAADVLGATRTSSSSRRPTSPAARPAPTDALVRHSGHEFGHVLSGTLRVVVGFDEFVLGPGDSITFPSSTPHRLSNEGTETVRAIWVVRGRRGANPHVERPRRLERPTGGAPMSGRALVVGVTGISGGNLAQRLLADGWQVAGLCRRPDGLDERITPLAADLEDADAVAAAVRGTRPDARLLHDLVAPRDRGREHATSTGACSRTCSTRSRAEESVRHVALVTGLKHYLGPFEAYAKAQPDTPFSEEQAAPAVRELLLRPGGHPLRGRRARRLHLVGAPAAHADRLGARQRHEHGRDAGRLRRRSAARRAAAFHFPGSREQWEAVTDVTDASLLADHLRLGGDDAGRREPGPQHRQRRRLPLAAAVAAAGRRARRRARRRSTGSPRRSSSRWPTPGRSGPRSCAATACATSTSSSLASWWHTDADLGRTVETFTDMGRSRRLGFLGVRDTESSFTDLFARLRAERIVP